MEDNINNLEFKTKSNQIYLIYIWYQHSLEFMDKLVLKIQFSLILSRILNFHCSLF